MPLGLRRRLCEVDYQCWRSVESGGDLGMLVDQKTCVQGLYHESRDHRMTKWAASHDRGRVLSEMPIADGKLDASWLLNLVGPSALLKDDGMLH